jgi:hypothetical protein
MANRARRKPTLPRSVLERFPKHVRAIGMISVELGNLEARLGDLLGVLLHIDSHFGRVVFLTPHSAAGRISILKNVLRDTLMEESEGFEHIEKLVERAEALIGKRNSYVHDNWGTLKENDKLVARIEPPQQDHKKVRIVPIQELTDTIKAIRKLARDVSLTVEEGSAAWPPYTWPTKPPSPPPRGPDRTSTPRGSGEVRRRRQPKPSVS